MAKFGYAMFSFRNNVFISSTFNIIIQMKFQIIVLFFLVAENIKSVTKGVLEEMGTWRTDNYYVTDNGSKLER